MMDIIIQKGKPITRELQGILSQCFVNKQNTYSTIDAIQQLFVHIKQMLKNTITFFTQTILNHRNIPTKNKHKCCKYYTH